MGDWPIEPSLLLSYRVRRRRGRGRGRTDNDRAFGRSHDRPPKLGHTLEAVGDLRREGAVEGLLQLGGPSSVRPHVGQGARPRRQSPNERLFRRDLGVGQLAGERVEQHESE